ncbi:MAG: glutathione S-transferase family protein [Beijerinckiaceae bacterium]|nr:glutathione S-transferase family protein [Beijerinckiaceae bacterium]
MITLYTFGPYYGIPDGSPFVLKAMLLLKLAGLEYREERTVPPKAPKGKLPFINDSGVTVADSTFIRFHIEKKYGVDFDAGLTPAQRAAAWATEKMCEEHLFLAMRSSRWLDKANFSKATAPYFTSLPLPLRLTIPYLVRRRIDKSTKFQGFGRHSVEEQTQLAIADIDALAALIGEKPFLMGAKACGADATVFGFAAQLLVSEYETPLRAAAERHQNLIDYRNRILRLYFPG